MYLTREDNTQKVYLTENTINVIDLLKENYGYIYDSINREEFIIKCPACSLFKELVFDGKVVGFCSYDFSREFLTAALNNIYVLPEFRGNGLFRNELAKTMEDHNKPSIMEPTRLVVELLIKYGFAEKVNDTIVASSIEFITPGDHVMSNSEYESSEELSTHFYDLRICRSIHFLDIEKGHLAYSAPLNYDIIHYDCLDYDVDDDYLNDIKDFFLENEIELMNTLLDLEERLPVRNYTLEEVIGEGDELSPYIESLIDDAHITYSDALRIRNQIKEEYEAGMILNESLMIRLAYLFDKCHEPTIRSHSDTCPYCEMPVDDHDLYCHFCGINLTYNPDEVFKSLLDTFNESENSQAEDIRYVAYKFLKLIEEKIPAEYAVFTIENTYDIDWPVLKSFLDENSYFSKNIITPEGYDFLKNHPLNLFEKYHMDIVDYTDFENYYYENMDFDSKTVCINYLKRFDDERCVRDLIDEIRKS